MILTTLQRRPPFIPPPPLYVTSSFAGSYINGKGIMKGILMRKYELLFESAKPVHVYNIMRLRPYPPLYVIFFTPKRGEKSRGSEAYRYVSLAELAKGGIN
jgi:hypothetical protein